MTVPTITAIAERARETGEIAIDTEFVGEGRYRPLLCLVQVAVTGADGDQWVEVIDPLDGVVDPAPLVGRSLRPRGRDRLPRRPPGRRDPAARLGCRLRNVFDTQIAAGFAGLRAQLGYEALLSELLGVRLQKSASFTRWDKRPLTDEQFSYAREDVLHLLEAAEALKQRLERQQRLQWAYEECRTLEDGERRPPAEAVFARLPRVNSLEPGLRAVAFALTQWREDCAMQEDKPVQTVLSDAALVEIAKRRPKDLDRLRQIRGLHEGTVRRRGKAILDAVARGRELPPIPVDGDRPPPSDARDAALIVLAEALVRARAAESGFAYELLASRSDLQQIVTAVRLGLQEPAVRTLHGWRRDLVGAELLELLAGRRSLRVGDRLQIAVDG